MNANRIEGEIRPIDRVDVWDVANRGIPINGIIQPKNVTEQDTKQSEARKKFIEDMNA